MKCAKAEAEKISSMLDEFTRTGDKEILQKACRKFSNNKEGNETYFTLEKWETLCKEKGIQDVPKLPDRIKNFEKRIEERKSKTTKQTAILEHKINPKELKENYEETSQSDKEKAISELKKRANLIMRENQNEMEKGEDVVP